MAPIPGTRKDRIGDIGQLVRQLGSFLLRHAAGVLALGAVVLYGIGLFRRLGQLSADHLDAARALPLSPLQTYLLSGLSVVLSTTFVLLLLAAAGAFVFADELIGARPDNGKVKGGVRQSWLWEKLEPPFLICLFAVFLALLPIRYWLPPILVGGAFVGLYLALVSRGVLPQSPADFSPAQLRVAGVGIAAVLIAAVSIQAYFNPPPLDKVKIRTDSGEEINGKLLTQDSGFVYLAKLDTRPQHESSILAFSTSQIESMHISEGAPRLFKTLPEVLGLRLWRLDIADDRPLLQRSP